MSPYQAVTGNDSNGGLNLEALVAPELRSAIHHEEQLSAVLGDSVTSDTMF